MFFKKVKKADLEAVSSRNADQERQENKMMRAWISFGVVIILLILLFFASINIGSLKVGFGELLSGLFVKYNKDVATIYDLRFPRIIISMLAGAAIAVSGVLFQAVLKNPLADPGIIGISSGASFTAVIITAFCTNTIFLHTDRSICRWCGRIFHGVLFVMEGWLKSDENYLNWCGSKQFIYWVIQCLKFYVRRGQNWCGSNR